MIADTDWSAVSDAAHRDWVDSERNEKLEELEAEVIRLRAELNAATKAGLDAIATICEKEREADALRVDAERYRWLRDCSAWSDAKNPCPYSKSDDGQLRCITAGLDAAIDAAMGEGK